MPHSFQLPHAISNPTSLVGAGVVTVSAALFLILLLLETFGLLGNPYLGLLIFVALPLVFLVGLILVPVGAWRTARRRAGGLERPVWPVMDLGQPRQRAVAGAVAALTFVNVVIVALAAYGGVHYMESTEFCGQVCHVTMKPQFTAHQAWAHASISCTSCHVGPGVGSSLEAKLAGTRQLFRLVSDAVPRPIPSPVASRARTSATCGECHTEGHFRGSTLREIRDYGDDEENSENVTRLLMRVGAADREGSGSHRHLGLDIEYVAVDEQRATIPFVRVEDDRGAVREYTAEGATPEQITAGRRRRMDCLDCHSRPAHTFDFTPARGVDRAIARGSLPRDLPYLRREAVAAVTAEYQTAEAALAAIAARLQEFYAMRPGTDGALVERAVAATQEVWSRNVFPEMGVTWGSYPNHFGHVDTPGCFRCHDDRHVTAAGARIAQDCELCHRIQ